MTFCNLYETLNTRYGCLTIFANDEGAVSQSLRRYGEWAENELSFLHAMVDEGETVIDVGAYIGTHALAFSRFVGPKGRVVAIEPQPLSFELLTQNIEANQLTNVRVENAAVSFLAGEATIPLIDIERRESFGSASLLGALAEREARRAERLKGSAQMAMRVISIDALDLADCALIKIDVEGAEDLVLRGAQKTVQHSSPIIYAECNSLERGLRSFAVLRELGCRVLAHVVLAYNAGNFVRDQHNMFGQAREMALVGVGPKGAERISRYQVRPHEMLLDIETADDLALALLNKPQYWPEILASSAAAKSGGSGGLDGKNKAEAQALLELRGTLDRTQSALAEAQHLAMSRFHELNELRADFARTDNARAEAQDLAVRRFEELKELRGTLDRTQSALGEAQHLATSRFHELNELRADFARTDHARAEAQDLAVRRFEELKELRRTLDRLGAAASQRHSEIVNLRQQLRQSRTTARESLQAIVSLKRENAELKVRADARATEKGNLVLQYESQRTRADVAEDALDSIYASRSWRFLLALRAIPELLGLARRAGLAKTPPRQTGGVDVWSS